MAENNFKLTAWIQYLHIDNSWRLEALDQPEFIGDGLDTLEKAREAAKDAIEYINAATYEDEFGEPQAPREMCEEVIISDADDNEIERVHA